ncbi:MAG: DUF6132 family protein [Eubacteriales bacterium]|nr:DUF6132 family protein [Eubacteriales bacterium]
MDIKLATRFFKAHIPTLMGVGIGLVAGYLYYRFVGCASGTCPLTSNPVITTLYGGVVGALVGSLFQKSG